MATNILELPTIGNSRIPVLEKAGISTQQASDWERLSEVPEDQFEAALAQKSVRDLIDKRRLGYHRGGFAGGPEVLFAKRYAGPDQAMKQARA